MQEFSDTRESIDRASKASGAKKMLDELAKKMRAGTKSDICDEIIAIMNEARSARKRRSYTRVGGCMLFIDMPKRAKQYYHGSTYEIECSEPYKIAGMVTTELRDSVETSVVDKLNSFGCKIIDVHYHDGLTIKSTHIHFRWEGISDTRLKEIATFLRDY